MDEGTKRRRLQGTGGELAEDEQPDVTKSKVDQLDQELEPFDEQESSKYGTLDFEAFHPANSHNTGAAMFVVNSTCIARIMGCSDAVEYFLIQFEEGVLAVTHVSGHGHTLTVVFGGEVACSLDVSNLTSGTQYTELFRSEIWAVSISPQGLYYCINRKRSALVLHDSGDVDRNELVAGDLQGGWTCAHEDGGLLHARFTYATALLWISNTRLLLLCTNGRLVLIDIEAFGGRVYTVYEFDVDPLGTNVCLYQPPCDGENEEPACDGENEEPVSFLVAVGPSIFLLCIEGIRCTKKLLLLTTSYGLVSKILEYKKGILLFVVMHPVDGRHWILEQKVPIRTDVPPSTHRDDVLQTRRPPKWAEGKIQVILAEVPPLDVNRALYSFRIKWWGTMMKLKYNNSTGITRETLVLSEMREGTFELLSIYVYSDSLPSDAKIDDLLHLLGICVEWGDLQRLDALATSQIERRMTHDTWDHVTQMAIHLGHTALYRICRVFMNNHVEDLVGVGAFKDLQCMQDRQMLDAAKKKRAYERTLALYKATLECRQD